MKPIIILMTMLLGAFSLSTQGATVDPSVSGIQLISPDTVAVGDTIIFEFNASNGGSDPTASIATGGFMVVISTPLDLSNNQIYLEYAKHETISTYGAPTGGSFFTWDFDYVEGVFYGVTNQPMGFLTNETVQVKYVATSPTFASTGNISGTGSVICGIEVHALLGTPNNIGNDLGTTVVAISGTTPMSIDDIVFDVEVDDCDIHATWNNPNEGDIEYYDLQYSEKYNYSEFRSLAEMPAKGENEKYFYNTDLNTGSYMFRLAAHNKSGEVGYVPTRQRNIDCDGIAKVRVKSNPVVGRTLELINTIQDDVIEIHDISGKLIHSSVGMDLITRISDISVAEGMYRVSVLREGQPVYSESVKF